MPGKKKILIVASAPLHPLNSMSKVRILNQMRGLSADHTVDFLYLWSRVEEVRETLEITGGYSNKLIPVRTFSQSVPFKAIKKIFLNRLFAMTALPMDYFIPSNNMTSMQIAGTIDRGNYDIVISHYWHASGFLRYLKNPVLKCIDAHYVVEENIRNYKEGTYSHIDDGSYGKLLEKELALQKKYFGISDLVILNSASSKEILTGASYSTNFIVVPNGQDLSYFLDYKPPVPIPQKKDILFYGALSSQFNSKALKRTLNSIFPEIRKQEPEARLVILGSNPPEWLNEYREREDISILGFVEDIRPVLAGSWLSLIPLESGSGFRGRTIELMAMGVPVIGTHNALDCLEFENGKEGSIMDDDDGIVNEALRLLRDKPERDRIAANALEFVKEKYTIESTFGMLSRYFTNLD